MEFALLAPIFFMLVSGLIEFVLYQFRVYTLNNVVYEAARNLQTGEVAAAGNTEAAFRSMACADAGAILDCASIWFDVRHYSTIGAIDFPDVVFDSQGTPTNFAFEPGGRNEYSVVRAAIHHQFVTPFLSELMGMGPELPAIVNSYSVVRNEPW